MLVTLPRVFGYLFNPVSFYFCYDRHGAPVAALAEVTNTFKEMKPYFLAPETKGEGREARGERSESQDNPPTRDESSSASAPSPLAPRPSPAVPAPLAPRPSPASETKFHLRTPKHFYVSPFSDVDVAFDFTLRTPGENLSVQIDDYVGSERTLATSLAGPRRALTNARLAWFTLKYPLLTLRIIGLIHWHAFLLWLKRVPWFAKSARAAEQRALFRPHASIARTPDAA